MKIFGDESSTRFKTYFQEPGIIYGHHDVLAGERKTHRRITVSFLGMREELIATQPKLYLHVFNSFWSSFTGILKEYCLPWRWKTAYLDQENGTPPQRILVCTTAQGGELSNLLNALIGQPLFIANLISTGHYEEIFGQEHLRIPRPDGRLESRILQHPLGKWFALQSECTSDDLCHIHRIRGVFSSLKYHLLKNFSSEWEEVTMQAGRVSENVLIKKNDRAIISRVGLIS